MRMAACVGSIHDHRALAGTILEGNKARYSKSEPKPDKFSLTFWSVVFPKKGTDYREVCPITLKSLK